MAAFVTTHEEPFPAKSPRESNESWARRVWSAYMLTGFPVQRNGKVYRLRPVLLGVPAEQLKLARSILGIRNE